MQLTVCVWETEWAEKKAVFMLEILIMFDLISKKAAVSQQ